MTRAEDDANRRAREIDNLRAVYETLQPPPPGSEKRLGRVAAWGTVGAVLLFLATKAKFLGLLAGLFKFKTLATMLLSIGAYAIEWGLPFAVGFVLLIFVHEAGHALAMRREGLPAGAPVFIPFVGAFIAMRGQPRDAVVEARIALAGPVIGSLAAWAMLAAGLAAEHRLLFGLGHAGVLVNLFNLAPVVPLDGGRVAGAFSRPVWVAGYVVGALALLVTRSPLLLIVLLVGLWTLSRRWNDPVPSDPAFVARRRTVALAYAALVAALVTTLAIEAPPAT